VLDALANNRLNFRLYSRMPFVELKLKQASAVLGVDPKDLQNLVQMKVLRPPRRKNFYWFDSRLLLEAKLAFYLKESLARLSGI
jgi:hypothetical protein